MVAPGKNGAEGALLDIPSGDVGERDRGVHERTDMLVMPVISAAGASGSSGLVCNATRQTSVVCQAVAGRDEFWPLVSSMVVSATVDAIRTGVTSGHDLRIDVPDA
jgi:hypothetical protein